MQKLNKKRVTKVLSIKKAYVLFNEFRGKKKWWKKFHPPVSGRQKNYLWVSQHYYSIIYICTGNSIFSRGIVYWWLFFLFLFGAFSFTGDFMSFWTHRVIYGRTLVPTDNKCLSLWWLNSLLHIFLIIPQIFVCSVITLHKMWIYFDQLMLNQ